MDLEKIAATFSQHIFIDIETVSLQPSYAELPESLQQHWAHKVQFFKEVDGKDNSPEALFKEKAGIYAEFGKIVVIVIGRIVYEDGKLKLRSKILQNDDEKTLLETFSKILQLPSLHHPIIFTGHNIKEFDLPYLCRRMLVNRLPLPECLQLNNKKPWEIHHQDTLELWKFGDYKHYTSLDLLASILGVPSSKSTISGKDVGRVYYEENGLDQIAAYCFRDVFTTTLVYLHLKGYPNIELEPIAI